MKWNFLYQITAACDKKNSRKHVSDFEPLQIYDRLQLRLQGKDFWNYVELKVSKHITWHKFNVWVNEIDFHLHWHMLQAGFQISNPLPQRTSPRGCK